MHRHPDHLGNKRREDLYRPLRQVEKKPKVLLGKNPMQKNKQRRREQKSRETHERTLSVWNAMAVSDFRTTLVSRFPVLSEVMLMIEELQNLQCNIHQLELGVDPLRPCQR